MSLRNSVACLLCLCAASAAALEFPLPEGWSLETEVQDFDAENLWRHINGGAETFVDYGFELLSTAELRSGELLVSVNVNDMASPLNAFGIYHLQRSDDMERLDLGAAAAAAPPYQWLLLKGRYFVSVEPYEGDLDAARGAALLEAIASLLPGGNQLPEQLALLPDEGRVPGSERFTVSSFQGLAELDNILHADYVSANGDIRQRFIMMPTGGRESAAILSGLSAKWSDGEQGLRLRSVPYRGLIGLIPRNGYLLGAAGCADEEELRTLLGKASK